MAAKTIQRHASAFFRRFPWFLRAGNTIWRRCQARYSIGAVGVVFSNAGKVLLVEHAFHPKYVWGLPGGWVGHDEDPARTVEREVAEELALEVEVGPLLLAEMPYKNHLDLAYLCRAKGKIGELSYELLSYDWFTPEELPAILDVHRRAIERALLLAQGLGQDLWD